MHARVSNTCFAWHLLVLYKSFAPSLPHSLWWAVWLTCMLPVSCLRLGQTARAVDRKDRKTKVDGLPPAPSV
eukprot:7491033-Pyramimonas_sp.AAC.1